MLRLPIISLSRGKFKCQSSVLSREISYQIRLLTISIDQNYKTVKYHDTPFKQHKYRRHKMKTFVKSHNFVQLFPDLSIFNPSISQQSCTLLLTFTNFYPFTPFYQSIALNFPITMVITVVSDTESLRRSLALNQVHKSLALFL